MRGGWAALPRGRRRRSANGNTEELAGRSRGARGEGGPPSAGRRRRDARGRAQAARVDALWRRKPLPSLSRPGGAGPRRQGPARPRHRGRRDVQPLHRRRGLRALRQQHPPGRHERGRLARRARPGRHRGRPLRQPRPPDRLLPRASLLREPGAPARHLHHHREGLRPHRRVRQAPALRRRRDRGRPRARQEHHGHRVRAAPRPLRGGRDADRHGLHGQLLAERPPLPGGRPHDRPRLAGARARHAGLR